MLIHRDSADGDTDANCYRSTDTYASSAGRVPTGME
jgi:hypothetical protein